MNAKEKKNGEVRLFVLISALVALIMVFLMVMIFERKGNSVTNVNETNTPVAKRAAREGKGTAYTHRLVWDINKAVANKDNALLGQSVQAIRSDLPNMVPELIWLLNHGEIDAREIAAQLLAEHGSQEAVAVLIDKYQNTTDENLRRNLQQSILSIRSDDSIPEFVRYFEPEAIDGIRKLAELVLAQHGTPAVVDQLDRLYDSTDDIFVRRSVFSAIRNIRNPEAVRALREKADLRSQSRDKLEMYVDALVNIKTDDALSVLRSLETDPDPVRQAVGKEAISEIQTNGDQ